MYMFYFYRDFEKSSLSGNFYYDNKNLVSYYVYVVFNWILTNTDNYWETN